MGNYPSNIDIDDNFLGVEQSKTTRLRIGAGIFREFFGWA